MAGIEIEIEKAPKKPMGLVFDVPAGYAVPEGLEEDGTWDDTTTLTMTPEGKIKVLAINGVVLPDGEEIQEEAVSEETPESFVDGMAKVMKSNSLPLV